MRSAAKPSKPSRQLVPGAQAATAWPSVLLGCLALSLLCLALFLPGVASLPAVDRDEALFAQASKQMLESGDFIDIRFQEQPRYKKPVGIYWLQSASAALAGEDSIVAYRLPSLCAALAAVLLTYALGRRLFGERNALCAAALLGSCLVLGYEARQAKTDAVLLACVSLSQYGLARHYLAAHGAAQGARAGRGAWFALWLGLGAGMLVKGPIPLLVVGTTALSLCLWERSARWLASTRPWLGVPLALSLVAPWLVTIALRSKGDFLAQSLGRDLAGKLASAQESHAGFPGYYLALFALCAWPASLFAPQALRAAFVHRADPRIRFLVAWILPSWVVFELVATKLPHYVLPTYPAFALLAAYGLEHPSEGQRRWPERLWVLWWAVLGLVLGGAFLLVSWKDSGRLGWSALVCACILLLLAGFGLRASWLRQRTGLLAACLAGSVLFCAFSYGQFLPSLERPWIASRVALLVPESLRPVACAGLNEPSLVFALGTNTRFGDGREVAEALAHKQVRTALVESRQRAAFEERATALELKLERLGALTAFNYSKGREVELTAFCLAP